MRRRKLLFCKKTVLLIKWVPGVRFRFRKKPRSHNSMYYNIFTTTKPFDTFSIFEIFWNLIPSMCPNSKLDQNHVKTHKHPFPIKPKHFPTILRNLYDFSTVKTPFFQQFIHFVIDWKINPFSTKMHTKAYIFIAITYIFPSHGVTTTTNGNFIDFWQNLTFLPKTPISNLWFIIHNQKL